MQSSWFSHCEYSSYGLGDALLYDTDRGHARKVCGRGCALLFFLADGAECDVQVDLKALPPPRDVAAALRAGEAGRGVGKGGGSFCTCQHDCDGRVVLRPRFPDCTSARLYFKEFADWCTPAGLGVKYVKFTQ